MSYYWENFYKTHPDHTLEPSDFCKFICESFEIEDFGSIVDVCCGNGRDTYYLGRHLAGKGYVQGVDSAVQPQRANNVVFCQQSVRDFFSTSVSRVVYSRFGFHALEESEEDLIIAYANTLMLEFRSDKDYDFVDDHYRRLINGNDFLTKLIKKGFSICYFRESKGLAPYKNFDPWVIRVVAER